MEVEGREGALQNRPASSSSPPPPPLPYQISTAGGAGKWEGGGRGRQGDKEKRDDGIHNNELF